VSRPPCSAMTLNRAETISFSNDGRCHGPPTQPGGLKPSFRIARQCALDLRARGVWEFLSPNKVLSVVHLKELSVSTAPAAIQLQEPCHLFASTSIGIPTPPLSWMVFVRVRKPSDCESLGPVNARIPWQTQGINPHRIYAHKRRPNDGSKIEEAHERRRNNNNRVSKNARGTSANYRCSDREKSYHY
jgi:hypothetical protein